MTSTQGGPGRALRRWRHGQCSRAAGDEARSPNARRVGRPCLRRGCLCGPFSSGLYGTSDTAQRRRRDPIGRRKNPVAAMIPSTGRMPMKKDARGSTSKIYRRWLMRCTAVYPQAAREVRSRTRWREEVVTKERTMYTNILLPTDGQNWPEESSTASP